MSPSDHSQVLEHLGLVAGMFDELGLGKGIDQAIAQELTKRTVSLGQGIGKSNGLFHPPHPPWHTPCQGVARGPPCQRIDKGPIWRQPGDPNMGVLMPLSGLQHRHGVIMMHPRVPLTGEPYHVYRSCFANHGRLGPVPTLP